MARFYGRYGEGATGLVTRPPPTSWREPLTASRQDKLAIMTNASSLVGTTAVTSILGFVYWVAAARLFSPHSVGFASAAVSAMLLLGTLGMLGLGTVLVAEFPRRVGQVPSLLLTALLAAGATGGLLGIVYAVLAPLLLPELRPLASSPVSLGLFAGGASITAFTLVLDAALIGLLKGHLQLIRNTVFAVAKLGALVAAGIWLRPRDGLTIYAT